MSPSILLDLMILFLLDIRLLLTKSFRFTFWCLFIVLRCIRNLFSFNWGAKLLYIIELLLFSKVWSFSKFTVSSLLCKSLFLSLIAKYREADSFLEFNFLKSKLVLLLELTWWLILVVLKFDSFLLSISDSFSCALSLKFDFTNFLWPLNVLFNWYLCWDWGLFYKQISI